jgi:GWxTD domain-containing protein
MRDGRRKDLRIHLLGAFLPVLVVLATGGGLRGASLVGRGDFDFYLDVASLPAGNGEATQLLQVAVPTKELLYAERDGVHRADVRVTFDLRAGDESIFRKAVQLRDSRSAPPSVKDLSSFLCHIDSCSVAPGRYTLTVTVEDLQRRKQTLLGWIRKSYAASVVKDAAIEVAVPEAGALAMGDPILVWSIDPNGGFIPNPMQIYGLRKDTLTLFASAALPPGASADSLRVRIAVTKAAGDSIDEKRLTVPLRGGRGVFVESFDLAAYAAGDYRVLVEAEAGEGLFAAAGKDFTVAWELLNWQRPVRDILVEAGFLFDDDEYERFKRMTLGEQEAHLKSAWKRVDPTPQTAVNEAYAAFLARVRHADRHFGVFQRGATSDRGLVYVRFGPPDEIIVRPIPKDRADLLSGMEKVGDEYEIVLEGSRSDQDAMIRDTRPRIVSPERQRATRGNVGGDAGSFEIWSYNIKGDPIFPGDTGMTLKSGLRFLFLDSDGYGDYRLVGTSEDMYTAY